MYYSEEIITEIRERNNIVDVIGSFVTLKHSGSDYSCCCPFHSEKTPSFHVNPRLQMYHCFGCGKKGNVYTFLMNYENMTFPEAVKYLAGRVGLELPEEQVGEEERRQRQLRQQLMEIYKQSAMYYFGNLKTEKGKVALEYFAGRGLSWDIIKGFGLGYSDSGLYQRLKGAGYTDEVLLKSGLFTYREERGVRDKFWGRVMFPIMNKESKVIAFGGRILGDGQPKYLNSPETPIFVKGRHLYGLHLAHRTRKDHFILCEGYMDAIALHQAGFDQAVASLGTALTDAQAGLLAGIRKKVYLSYDNDGAGQEATLRAIPILRARRMKIKIVNMEPYKDPDEFIKNLGAEEYQKRLDAAEGSFSFEMRMLAKPYDLSEPDDRSQFIKRAAEQISRFEDPMERESYMDAFCRQYMVDRKIFGRSVNTIGDQRVIQEKNQEHYEEDKAARELRKDERNIYQEAEKIVLTWCVRHPDFWEQLEAILGPDDFSEGIFRDIARESREKSRLGLGIDVAAVLSRYETAEEQELAADICQNDAPDRWQEEAQKKALADTVMKLYDAKVKAMMERAIEQQDTNLLKEATQWKVQRERIRRSLL